MRYLFIILIQTFLFLSCGSNPVFEKKIDFFDLTWQYNNPIKAKFDISDKNQAYDIVLDVFYVRDYPFQNIYLKITDDFTGKENTDIVTVDLFDIYGSPTGESKGETYQKKILLRKGFLFQNNGEYHINMYQFSRKDSLEGVKRICFYIEKTKK